MRILKLESENIKRLQAVEITPQGDVVQICGQNAQGKSSVLDSIAYALGGKRAVCDMPVRNGQDKARVVCELEELIVSRTFTTAGGGSLVVSKRDGSRLTSPQAILDKLTNNLTFDPLAFTKMDTKHQLDTLKGLVGLDFTEQDQRRQALYDERTQINRDVKKLKANLEATPVHSDVPEKEISVSDLMQELRKRQEYNQANRQKREELQALDTRIEKGEGIEADLVRQIEEIQAKLDGTRTKLKELRQYRHSLGNEVQALTDSDEQAVMDKISGAEKINSQVQSNRERKKLASELQDLESRSGSLTEQMQAIDDAKAQALQDASFPVPGLSFNETGVLLNGIPFSQASQAEQLRVSVAMGFSMNPELKVLLVRDGSLLDDSNLKLLAELAANHDGQVWLERVGEGDECAVIIEDGKVRGRPATVEMQPPVERPATEQKSSFGADF